MRTNRANEAALVVAAQAGEPRAMEELLSAHLPLVYTIVRRAMNGDPDVDDVVQETMLRALRELPRLLNPESFRAWLAAIAVRQISTHRHRGLLRARRTVDLDELTEAAEAEPGFEEISVLQLELAGQRRQLVRARQWLDAKDQALLSLWWLESAGQLTRAELAEALGVSLAHATVRLQRMRTQLELSRVLVAAVEARPRCADLDRVLSGWDGRHSSPWRKRITRHTRSCPVCRRTADGLIAPESLLVALALLPVPLALASGVLGKLTLGGSAAAVSSAALGGGKVGVVSQLLQVMAAHPVTVLVVTGSVITGSAVVTTSWPENHTTPPVVIAVPSSPPAVPRPTRSTARPTTAAPTSGPPSAPFPTPARVIATATDRPGLTLAPGPASLESVSEPGRFVSTARTLGVLTPAGSGSSRQIRVRATFEVVPGLADPNCVSFRLDNGHYLRHASWRLSSFADDGGDLFRSDATFCPGTGSVPGSITLESSNYPGWFLHHRGDELWVDQTNGSRQFLTDSSFLVRSPLVS
jgi:RNA polymerase sigma factor (sigma-70 family)